VRVKKVGIKFAGFGCHTFRRTYPTIRTMVGYIAPPPELEHGHANSAMTARYIRQGERELVERIRNLIETSGDPREKEAESKVVSIDYAAAG